VLIVVPMLRIATQNLGMPQKSDGWKHRWSVRQKAHANLLNSNRFNLVALQELPAENFDDFKHTMNHKSETWEFVGDSYMNAVAFNEDFIHVADEPETFVYSDNAEGCSSAFTAVPFYDLGAEVYFTFIVTHLNGGDRAIRTKQTAELVAYAESRKTSEKPVIVAGDFNSLSAAQAVFRSADFADLWEATPNKENTFMDSYQGWTEKSKARHQEERVDAIFGSGSLHVIEAGVLPSVWHNVQASDHNAVWCEVTLND